MIKHPLQNAEAWETIAVVLLGIVLLCTLEPINSIRLVFAGVLAGLVIAALGISLWQRLHQH